ncbi:MAG TPA: MFS transporter, partial [Caulobacterales bacterium]|nr:MFS transporter [Caulobacterales bacterium]
MPDAGSRAAPSEPPKRLSIAQIFAFSATSLPTSALVIGIAIFLQPHLARNLGVPLMVVAGALFAVRMLDFGIDLVLGLLMDRFRWRLGRYRVWLVGGAPILAGGVAALFFAREGVGSLYLISALFALYLGLSILTLAHAAWSATVVTSYHERSRVFGLMAPIGVLGSLCALMFPVIAEAMHATSTQSIHALGWFIIILMPITVASVVWQIPEPITKDVKHASAPLREYWDLVKRPSFLRLLFGEAFLVLGPGWMSNIYIFFFT